MKMVVASDFHIGNERLPYKNFLMNIETYLYPELEDCDIFVVAGDFFDRSLKLDERAAHVAVEVIQHILEIAEKNGMVIKVLRGTWTHDRNQNDVWITLCEGMDVNIEYISSLSLSVAKLSFEKWKFLFIPDNLVYPCSEDCLVEIRKMLEDAKWNEVDFVIGHGYFKHVLPKNIPHEPKCTFKVEQFNDIVKHAIVMGHVHTPSKCFNCYYCGSFERLCHGEEEDKGFVVIDHDKETDTYNVRRVWNKDTTPFCTFDVNENVSFAINCDLLKQFVSLKYPSVNLWGYLRIRCNNPELRQQLEEFATSLWRGQLIVTSISTKQEQIKESFVPTELEFEVNQTVSPTLENISDLIIDYLNAINKTNGLTKEDVKKYVDVLIESTSEK